MIFSLVWKPMKSIAIIWAGAAGLMAAATILENGWWDCHIDLFEKNLSPGKKIILSWGGRCNVTTSIEDKEILATKYTRWWEFIRKAIGKFSPKKCFEWFGSHGVPLKIQDDLRVFPISDDGRDIVWVFQDIFAKYRDKVSLHYGEGVDKVSIVPVIPTEAGIQSFWMDPETSPGWQKSGLLCTPGWPLSSFHSDSSFPSQWQKQFLITTTKWEHVSDVLIITTWGNAYSHTGSTGDGYAFARALGHTVTQLGPSLSSFLTREFWLHSLSGLAFEDAKIGALTWPLLLTHFGISWPLTFMVSSHLAFEKIEQWTHKNITFTPLSSMRFADWESFLKDQFQLHPKKFITSILSEKLPRRFAEAFVKEYFSHIEATFVGSISRMDREKISKLLGEWIPLTLLERRPGDEFVTAGGVNTDELDPETMESKIHKNLYFAGEVLNVDGYTGGFSLQICWSSGYVAGKSILP